MSRVRTYPAQLLTAKSESCLVQGSLWPWMLCGLSSSFCLLYFSTQQDTFSQIHSRYGHSHVWAINNVEVIEVSLRPAQKITFQVLQPRAFWGLCSPPVHTLWVEVMDSNYALPVCYSCRIEHALCNVWLRLNSAHVILNMLFWEADRQYLCNWICFLCLTYVMWKSLSLSRFNVFLIA